MRRLIVVAVLLAACGVPPQDAAPDEIGTAADALVPGTGEGPFVLARRSQLRCNLRRDFWCIDDIGDAERVLESFVTNAPALDADRGFRLPRPINMSDGRPSTLNRPDDWRIADVFGSNNVDRLAASFSGLLEIPPATGTNEWSFVVGSDDGFRLRIFDGTAVRTEQHTGGRSFTYGRAVGGERRSFVVTFPAAGGRFPFELTWFDGTGEAGLELLWRQGAHPLFDGSDAWTIVPKERLYAPELRATLVAEKVGTGDLSNGDTVRWTVVLRNVGQAAAHPLRGIGVPGNPTGEGITYSTCIDNGLQFVAFDSPPAGVNARTGSGAGCSSRVYATVNRALEPGEEVRFSYRTRVQSFLGPLVAVCDQGAVYASTTDRPEIGRMRLVRRTDDPVVANGDDIGNTPRAFDPTASADDDESCVRIGDPLPPFVLESPAENEVVLSDRPAAAGRARANATVEVLFTGGGPTVGCLATVDSRGRWSCEPEGILADGTWTVTARLRDANGNVGPAQSHTFTVTTPPPQPPVLDPPASPTSDPLPTFTGTTRPYLTIELLDATGAVVCTATADAAGHFACGLATPLAEGTHRFTARAVDASGRRSGPSNAVTVVVDFTGPDVPILTRPGAMTNESRPLFQGTTEPGALVVIGAPGGELCRATADASGAFECRSGRPLADGPHTVSLLAFDVVGNIGTPGQATFTIDTVAPPRPVLDAMPGLLTTRTPTFRGSAEAGTDVTLRPLRTDGTLGDEVCRATRIPGRFECTSTRLLQGVWTFEATAIDAAGNESPRCPPGPHCSNQVRFILDDGPPDAPQFDEYPPVVSALPPLAGTAETGGTVRVTLAGEVFCLVSAVDTRFQCPPRSLPDGVYRFEAVVTDSLGLVSPPGTLEIEIDSVPPGPPTLAPLPLVVTTPRPTFSGTGEPRHVIQVRDGIVVRCETRSESDGTWRCQPTADLSQGGHVVVAVAIDFAGNVSPPSDVVAFTIDSIAPPPPVLDPMSSVIATSTPRFSGTAEEGSTVRVFANGELVCETVASSIGAWVCETSLPDGTHVVVATAVDAVGNESEPSAPLVVEVDTEPPPPPVIKPFPGPTRDPQPLVEGTAEAGAVVVVSFDGTEHCTSTASASGRWACQGEALADGTYTLTATARDELYRTSAPSEPVTLVIDRVAPPVPVITSPVADEVLERLARVTGTAPEAARVEFLVDGTSVGSGEVVDGAFAWNVPGEITIPLGTHTVVAIAIDAAGNRSGGSEPVTFDIAGGYFVLGGCHSTGVDASLVGLLAFALLGRRRRA